jgi:hypothetical protein
MLQTIGLSEQKNSNIFPEWCSQGRFSSINLAVREGHRGLLHMLLWANLSVTITSCNTTASVGAIAILSCNTTTSSGAVANTNHNTSNITDAQHYPSNHSCCIFYIALSSTRERA